jgi:hypothetical protein
MLRSVCASSDPYLFAFVPPSSVYLPGQMFSCCVVLATWVPCRLVNSLHKERTERGNCEGERTMGKMQDGKPLTREKHQHIFSFILPAAVADLEPRTSPCALEDQSCLLETSQGPQDQKIGPAGRGPERGRVREQGESRGKKKKRRRGAPDPLYVP